MDQQERLAHKNSSRLASSKQYSRFYSGNSWLLEYLVGKLNLRLRVFWEEIGFWIVKLGVRLWIEYVRSKSNIADDPSRGVFFRLKNLRGVEVPFFFPPVQAW